MSSDGRGNVCGGRVVRLAEQLIADTAQILIGE